MMIADFHFQLLITFSICVSLCKNNAYSISKTRLAHCLCVIHITQKQTFEDKYPVALSLISVLGSSASKRKNNAIKHAGKFISGTRTEHTSPGITGLENFQYEARIICLHLPGGRAADNNDMMNVERCTRTEISFSASRTCTICADI
jgi:hypothetical protein